MGSEQGMGWNWIVSLARYCELFVITEGEYRGQIEEWMQQEENALIARNIHFYYVPIGGDNEAKCAKIRRMCWNQGDWRFYKYYKDWQKKVADKARRIIDDEEMKVMRKEADHGIDVLHQLNMIGFREPGYLWRFAKVYDIPFVWGPVDAKDRFPLQYAEGAGVKTKAFLWLKNQITVWQLKNHKRVRKAADNASVLLSSSSNSVCSFKRYMGKDSVLMNETGCHGAGERAAFGEMMASADGMDERRKDFDILWVGKMDFRKQLGLALETVAALSQANVKLHVVGGGNAEMYKKQAMRLGIRESVLWHGAVSHSEVQAMMRKCDVMLFTSVAEGTPHVVLEALANGLPVVCHDTCGQGDSVNDKVGIKVPLSNPQQSVKDFAAAISALYDDREMLKVMSENCYARAEDLSWDNKARQMVKLYDEAVREKRG